MEQYTSDCFDAIAVFLSVHIVLRYRSIVAKRAVPALDRQVAVCVVGRMVVFCGLCVCMTLLGFVSLTDG